MQDDRQAILDLFPKWHTATKNRDIKTLTSLMTDDVVFLTPGQPPMRGPQAFADAFQAIPADLQFEIGEFQVQELQVEGHWAYCWCSVAVSLISPQKGPVRTRKGYTLSVLRQKADRTWAIARDANLLADI